MSILRHFPAVSTSRPPLYTIGLISASAIAYEILLMRLFSIIQWHHFAYMVISLAMLGYGASGTFLVFFRQRLLENFVAGFLGNIMMFSLSLLTGFLVGQHIPFNPDEIFWDAKQLFYLAGLSLLLTLPFFFAANTVALGFMRYKKNISRIYAMDLIGASLGSLLIIVLLFLFFPVTILKILVIMAFWCVASAWWEFGLAPRSMVMLLAAASLMPLFLPAAWIEPVLSPYKGLSQQLRIPGSRTIAEYSSPLGQLTVVENNTIPLRHAPGLSLNASSEPPPQLAVFTDGNAMTAITKDSGELQRFSYLDQMTSALPYHLGRLNEVLIVGGGGGADVLQARFHNVPLIDVLELNRQMADLVLKDYGDWAGNLYRKEGVTLHVGEARGFITTSDGKYDLIGLPQPSSFGAAAGLHSVSENYLFTEEAFSQYLQHLNQNGYLAVSSWIRLPPRETLKLLATAVAALEKSSFPSPEKRIILIRGWQTSTLLVKKGFVTEAEITALKKFCRQRSFDVCFYPGMDHLEANQYNILKTSFFHQGATALLSKENKNFQRGYKFSLKPATDDSPYFSHFFKWRVLPEILELRGEGGVLLMEWGYLILVATLLQAFVMSLLFILLPLLFFGKQVIKASFSVSRWRIFAYFFAIGLAFLFLEIAFIQKFILFLSHPIYAVAVTLSSFLFFAGLGSLATQTTGKSVDHKSRVRRALSVIFGLGLLSLFFLDILLNTMLASPMVIKIGVAIVCMAPLAYFMGMIFPLGIGRVTEQSPEFVPWAWAINGCASVLSSILATLLAIHTGFTAVVVAALLLYGIAFLSFPETKRCSLS